MHTASGGAGRLHAGAARCTSGVAVAKKKLEVSLLHPDMDQSRFKTGPNTPAGLVEWRGWLGRPGVTALAHVQLLLAATGVYPAAAALWFSQAGAPESVVTPVQAQAFGQGWAVRPKPEARDSQVLARYGALVPPPRWQPPSPEIRALQALIARWDAIEIDLRRQRHRQETTEAVPVPATVLDSLRQPIAFWEQKPTRWQTAIHDHINHPPGLKPDQDWRRSLPAGGDNTAPRLPAAQRRRDLTSADPVTACLGWVPSNCQSGSSLPRRPRRLSQAGAPRLRGALDREGGG